MTTKKWNVVIGDIRDEVSADLLSTLKFSEPYSNDQTCTARFDNMFSRGYNWLAAAYAKGLRGDQAALDAIRATEEERSAQAIENARQKVAELELAAARNRREAAQIELQVAQLKNGRKEAE